MLRCQLRSACRRALYAFIIAMLMPSADALDTVTPPIFVVIAFHDFARLMMLIFADATLSLRLAYLFCRCCRHAAINFADAHMRGAASAPLQAHERDERAAISARAQRSSGDSAQAIRASARCCRARASAKMRSMRYSGARRRCYRSYA